MCEKVTKVEEANGVCNNRDVENISQLQMFLKIVFNQNR